MHAMSLQRLPRRLRLATATALLATAVGFVDLSRPTGQAHAAAVTYNGAAGAERISVIGDSVMAAIRWYGTWTPLRTYNYTVDVESCRRTLVPSCRGREGYTPDTTVNAMRRLEGQLGSVLTIGTGYDDPGSTFDDAVDAVMAEAARQGIPVVVWATMRTEGVVYVGPTYAANAATYRANNQVLFAKQSQYGGRLVVADWATYSANHPEWVEWDGVHLTPSGATAMATFIRDQSARAIRRISVPSAPTLTTTVLSSSQIRLSWTRPASVGAAPIEHYSYQRSSDGGRTWQTGYAGASARSALVSGLTNGVTYRFRIAAYNRIGWGAWSSTVSVTPRVVAPSAPWLSAAAVGPGQVKLWWTAPTYTGGAPIEYYSFQRSSDGGRTWQTGYAGASARSVVVSGLTNGATYRFRIVAHNRIGFGVWSRTVSVTARVVAPSPPWLSAAVAGSGQVRLDWAAPTFTGGAPIEHYTYHRSSDGGRTWHASYAVASARSAVVGGLTNGVAYRFRIAAYNRVGWSAWSRTVIVTPSASVAGVSPADDAGGGEASVVTTTVAPTTTVPTTSVPDVTAPTTTTTSSTQPPADATVGDFIWLDSDGNGVQDAHEPGLPGVTVRLIGPDETVVAAGVSDPSGQYVLTPPSPGPLLLEVVLPDGYAPTVVDVGADDTVDSDADPVDVVDDSVERTVRVASDSSNGHVVDLDVGLVVVPPPPSTTTLPATTTTSAVTTVPTSTTTATDPTTTTSPPTTSPPSSAPTTPPPTAPPTTATAPTSTVVVTSTTPETSAPTEPSGPDG